MPTHALRLIGSLLIVLLLAACGGAAAPEPTAAPAPTAEPAPDPTALPADDPTAAPATDNATGDAPAAGAGIVPVFPGAAEPAADDPVGIAIDALKQEFAQQEEGTVNGYLLPEGVTFEDLVAFYDTEMEALGWQKIDVPEAEVDPEMGGILFYENPGQDEGAAIFISLGAVPIDGGGNLLLILEGISTEELPN